MTTDDPILRELSDADPAAGPTDVDAAETERVLRYALSDAAPDVPAAPDRRSIRRPWRPVLLAGLSVLVVAAVVVIVIGAAHRGGSSVTPGAERSLTLIYRVRPTPQAPRLTSEAIDHELALIGERLRGLGTRSRVMQVGADEIKVSVSTTQPSAAAAVVELQIAATDSVQLYDWEANALLTSGRTVVSAGVHHLRADMLSQGTEEDPPGTAVAGGVTLYQAVKLAASRPAAPTSAALSRRGPEYFSFGAPGSRGCATAAADRGAVPVAGDHCYLAGPAATTNELRPELPRGVSATDQTVLKVPQGIVVLQASNQSGIGIGAAAARFFVLRDRVAVSGGQVIDPRAGSDAGYPNVQFALTPLGRRKFQSMTATIAHRGQMLSTGSSHMFEHFAVALDGRLLAVPQIDFTKYPDGVIETPQNDDAEIPTVSRQQAEQIVTQLRLGPLPLALHLVSARR